MLDDAMMSQCLIELIAVVINPPLSGSQVVQVSQKSGKVMEKFVVMKRLGKVMKLKYVKSWKSTNLPFLTFKV